MRLNIGGMGILDYLIGSLLTAAALFAIALALPSFIAHEMRRDWQRRRLSKVRIVELVRG